MRRNNRKGAMFPLLIIMVVVMMSSVIAPILAAGWAATHYGTGAGMLAFLLVGGIVCGLLYAGME